MRRGRNKILALLPFFNIIMISNSLQYDCSKFEYDRCIQLADPLVKEVQFIFPDNINDVDLVCRTWNNFVDCLKGYTEKCFSSQQRRQFNKAVETPIASVHQMCTQPSYQKEYLRYAPCMKSTVVKGGRCGPHYNLLVDQVNQGDVISKATLCCSHNRFKQCVVRETQKTCDRGVSNGPAASFSAQIIDKALSFLQDQCYNYIPNSGDCAVVRSDDPPSRSDSVMVSTSPADVYRWENAPHVAPKEFPTSRSVPPSVSPTSWLPSTDFETSLSPISRSETTNSIVTPALGSRSRPASYGRSGSWFNNKDQEASNVVQTISEVPPPSRTPVRSPSGATISSWTVVNPSMEPSNRQEQDKITPNVVSSSSTTWYPAAGSQLSNEVDEPNQMGLVKPDNSANGMQSNLLILPLIFLIFTTFN